MNKMKFRTIKITTPKLCLHQFQLIEPRAILTNIISVFPSAKHVPYFASRKTANYISIELRRSCASQLRAQREEVHWQAKVAPSENHGRKYNCLSLPAILQTTKGTSTITAKRIRSSKPTIYR